MRSWPQIANFLAGACFTAGQALAQAPIIPPAAPPAAAVAAASAATAAAAAALPAGAASMQHLHNGLQYMSEATYHNCINKVALTGNTAVDYQGPSFDPNDRDTMLCESNIAEKQIRFNQMQSYVQYTNELELCTVDSILGKSDDECASGGPNPNCAGASGALDQVVHSQPDPTCVPTPLAPCPFMANGFTAEDWLTGADRHLTAGNQCINRRSQQMGAISDSGVISTDNASVDERKADIAILNPNYLDNPMAVTYAAVPNRATPTGSASSRILPTGANAATGLSRSASANANNIASESGSSRTKFVTSASGSTASSGGGPASGASRSSGAVIMNSSGSGAATHSQFQQFFDSNNRFIGDDGSKSFGLENGEVLRRVQAGESLRQILRDSPVAKKFTAIELAGRLGPETKEDGAPEASNRAMLAKQAPAGNARDPGSRAMNPADAAKIFSNKPETGGSPKDRAPASATKATALDPHSLETYRELSIFDRVAKQYRSRTEDFLTVDYHLNTIPAGSNGVSPSAPVQVE